MDFIFNSPASYCNSGYLLKWSKKLTHCSGKYLKQRCRMYNVRCRMCNCCLCILWGGGALRNKKLNKLKRGSLDNCHWMSNEGLSTCSARGGYLTLPSSPIFGSAYLKADSMSPTPSVVWCMQKFSNFLLLFFSDFLHQLSLRLLKRYIFCPPNRLKTRFLADFSQKCH